MPIDVRIVDNRVRGVIEKAFERFGNPGTVYDENATIEDTGLDSLAFSELIIEYEEAVGPIPEDIIDRMMSAENLGELVAILDVKNA